MTGQIYKKIKSKIKNYIFIKRNFGEYDKFQWKSAEEIERIRTKKLKDIVKNWKILSKRRLNATEKTLF